MLATVLVFWFFCMHKLFEKALCGLDLVLLLKKKKAQFYTQLHSEAGRGRRKKRWLTSLICDSGVTNRKQARSNDFSPQTFTHYISLNF